MKCTKHTIFEARQIHRARSALSTRVRKARQTRKVREHIKHVSTPSKQITQARHLADSAGPIKLLTFRFNFPSLALYTLLALSE